MLKWLKSVKKLWELDPPPERWDLALASLSDEDKARYKALLADRRAYAHMNWDEFREYIREQGLPPPPPHKKRRAIVF